MNGKVNGIETFDDYKPYLIHRIEAASEQRGYRAQMAQAAGCHPSFLSQVLNGPVQITPDQAVGISAFLGLDEIDDEIFLSFVQLARASSPLYQRRLRAKLSELKERKLNLANRFQTSKVGDESHVELYYSNWIWSALHVMASVPRLRTAERMAEHLQVPLSTVENSLQKLKEMGLVNKIEQHWVVTLKNIHLPKKSPMLTQHLSNWRYRALIDASEKKDSTLHYTAIHALSRQDAEKIRIYLTQALEHVRTQVAPSSEEVVICFNLDYFPI